MAYKLLIVDDSPSMRQVIIKIIRISGTDVGEFIEAGNGHEALAKLKDHWVDLVISDLYMPEMDGFELLRQMKGDPLLSEIPVLVVSTESREAKLQEIYEMGVKGFIHKPFRPETVRDLILSCLGGNTDAMGTVTTEAGDF